MESKLNAGILTNKCNLHHKLHMAGMGLKNKGMKVTVVSPVPAGHAFCVAVIRVQTPTWDLSTIHLCQDLSDDDKVLQEREKWFLIKCTSLTGKGAGTGHTVPQISRIQAEAASESYH